MPLKSPPDFGKLARGNKKIYHVTGSNIRVYSVLASSAIAICFIFLPFVLERIDFRCSNGLGRFCPGAIFFCPGSDQLSVEGSPNSIREAKNNLKNSRKNNENAKTTLFSSFKHPPSQHHCLIYSTKKLTL